MMESTSKPLTNLEVKLSDENGNAINLASIVAYHLKRTGNREYAKEVQKKVFECESYDSVLNMLQTYVKVY